MKNILHVTMHYFPQRGGQEYYIENLNRLIESEDVCVKVMQPKNVHDIKKPENVIYMPKARFIGRFIKGADWFWFNSMLLVNHCIINEQDVVICHYPFHYPAIKKRRNVIVVSHGVDWPDKPSSLFDRYKYHAFEQLCKKRPVIIANDTEFLRKMGIKIEPSEKYFMQVEENIWFVPNCVDTDKFKKISTEKQNIILVPRNVRRSRGVHLAIEAFNLFKKEHDEYKLVIAGGIYSNKYFNYCLKLVDKYEIGGSVHFLGNIQNDELIRYYQTAKITLIPTIAYEGTSMSALESMACQTPVVSTKIGGLKDLPTYKAEDDPIDICRALIDIADRGDEIAQMQSMIVRRVFNMHNWGEAWRRIVNKEIR